MGPRGGLVEHHGRAACHSRRHRAETRATAGGRAQAALTGDRTVGVPMTLSPRVYLPSARAPGPCRSWSARRARLERRAPLRAPSDVAGARYRLDAASAKRSGAQLLRRQRASARPSASMPAVAPRRPAGLPRRPWPPRARRPARLIALVDGLGRRPHRPDRCDGRHRARPRTRQPRLPRDRRPRPGRPRATGAARRRPHRCCTSSATSIDHALLDRRRRRPRSTPASRPAGAATTGQLGRLRQPRGALRRELRQVGDGRHRREPRHRLPGPAARRTARRLGRSARPSRRRLNQRGTNIRHIWSDLR